MTAKDNSRGRGITRLPDFLVVGPPRTGTTWLHGVLYHRACLPERTKETHFFDMFYSKGIDWYRAYFRRCADEAIAGEVTPTYFSLAHVRERIARDLPGCKIVCTLRDPVARAWSWYRLGLPASPWRQDPSKVPWWVPRTDQRTATRSFGNDRTDGKLRVGKCGRVLGEQLLLPFGAGG